MQNMFNSSLLSSADSQEVNYQKHKYANSFLRIGTVVKRYTPKDKGNKNKITDEYDVTCVEQKANKGITHRTYKGCISATAFGTATDFCYFKYKETENKEDILNGRYTKTPEGSRVLLLMVDGFSEHAVIIGSMPHPDSPDQLEGHSMYFQYNDVKATIADDGQFDLEFLKSNTKLTVTKDGDVRLFLNDGFELQAIKKDGKVLLTVPEIIDVKTKTVLLEATKEVNAKIAKLLIEGKQSALKIDEVIIEGKKFQVKSKQVEFEGNQITLKGSNVEIKGSTIKLSGKVSVGEGGTPAVTLATKFIGTGNLGGPVLATAVGPFSSSVFIAS